MKRMLMTISTMFLPALALATELTISTDVPVDLGSTTYLATQTVRHLDGTYSLGFDGALEGLDPAVSISSLALREDGSFLFTSDVPVQLDGVWFEPRDVIAFDGTSYSGYLDGAALSFSTAARIDAISLFPDGDLALSFADPEGEGSAVYMPADVVRVDGAIVTLEFDASINGISDTTNLTAFEQFDTGERLFSFDRPVTLGATTYLPGQIVHNSGASYSLYFDDPDFPGYAATSALSLPGSPGEATNLFVDKTGADVALNWSPTCSTQGTDYGVFEGAIGSFGGHLPVTCSTAGLPSSQFQPGAGNRYFLVVPNNGAFEGSYGVDSDGVERAASTAACQIQQKIRSCP